MKTRYIDVIDGLTGGGSPNQKSFELPAGNFAYLMLILTGTTASGQTLTLDDIGSIKVTEDDFGEIINADMGFFNSYGDEKGGYLPTVSGSANTAETVVMMVPFEYDYLKFPNVLQLERDNQAWVNIQFGSDFGTLFSGASPSLTVVAFEKPDTFQSYYMPINSQNLQAQGSGTLPHLLTGGNVASLFLRDAGSNVTEIQYTSDGMVVIDNRTPAQLQYMTNWINRVESSGLSWFEIANADSPVEESTRNSKNQLLVKFSGAGTLDIYKFQFAWLSEQATAENQARVQARLNNKGS